MGKNATHFSKLCKNKGFCLRCVIKTVEKKCSPKNNFLSFTYINTRQNETDFYFLKSVSDIEKLKENTT